MRPVPMARQLNWFPLHRERPADPPAGTPAPPAQPARRPVPPADEPEFPVRPTARDRHSRDRPDISEQARRQLEANGQDAVLSLMGVLQQNFDLRDERRELNEEIQRLQPRTGEIRLNREQAQLWQSYNALNLTPDQVHALQTRDTERTAAEAAAQNDSRADRAAELLGYAPKLLRRLIRQDGLEIEIRTVTRKKEGTNEQERIEVPYVKKAGVATATPEPLEDYEAAHWQEDLGDALRAVPAEGSTVGREEPETPAPPRVVPLPRQGPAGRVRGTDVVGSQLQRRYPLPKHLVDPGGEQHKRD